MAEKVHSEQFFGDTREFWWNLDFLELMAKRWSLSEVKSVLDVGCGRGHWGQALAKVLPRDSRLTGIDPEPASIALAGQRAVGRALNSRFDYKVGRAEKLDFPDHSFDLVTCQTLLIHVPEPQKVLQEMIRVARPGGLVICVEPNNQSSAMIRDSLDLTLEDQLENVAFQCRCERGKKKLGLGFNSLGDSVPGFFQKCGLKDIQVYNSDKAIALLPPYSSQEQKALRAEMIDWAKRELYLWDKVETQKYFMADGGTQIEFEAHWKKAGKVKDAISLQLEKGIYTCAGGGIVYLVSGRK